MNTRIPTLLALGATLLLGSSCDRKDDPKSSSPEITSPKGFGGQLVHLLPEGMERNPTLFLGNGFDLLGFDPTDDQGVRHSPIVDIQRIQSGQPWAPFGGAVASTNTPVIETVKPLLITTYNPIEDLSVDGKGNFLDVGGLAPVRKPVLNYTRGMSIADSNQVYTFRRFEYRKLEQVELSANSASDYIPFLSESFVRDLKSLDPLQLVRTYGTHLITSYYLGPSSMLVVSSLRAQFSRLEARQLLMGYSGIPVAPETKEKLVRSGYNTELIYEQRGSTYNLDGNVPSGMEAFTIGGMGLNTQGKWEKEIVAGAKPFLSLAGDIQGVNLPNDLIAQGERLIPISDLILDKGLRSKYVGGLMERAYPNQSISYLLCDPTTLESVKYKDKWIFINLVKFASEKREIYLIKSAPIRFTRATVEQGETVESTKRFNWSMTLDQATGLWTIQDPNTGEYLGRDLKFHPKDETDTSQLYWVLNPIVPTDGYHTLRNRFFK